MKTFNQLLQINPSDIPHDGLKSVVETLQKEYSQAKDKSLVEETLGERAKQAMDAVKAKFSKAIGDRSRVPDVLTNWQRLVDIGQASLVELFNTYIKEERQLVIDVILHRQRHEGQV